jgi:hypothetical protein
MLLYFTSLWRLKGRMLEYCIIRSGWLEFSFKFFYSVWIFILCDSHLCLLLKRSMNVHLHRQSVLMFCTLLPYRGWKGGCLSTASSGQVGGVFCQLFYSVWIFILCDFHLCLLKNRGMNVHLHRQSVLCCCTLPPWRLKGRMLEYCIIRSSWRSFPSTFFTVYEFLFFVISISVCSKTEVWMYNCIDNEYYVAVLYLPGGWKGRWWCSQPRLFHVRKDSKSYASSFVVLNYPTVK